MLRVYNADARSGCLFMGSLPMQSCWFAVILNIIVTTILHYKSFTAVMYQCFAYLVSVYQNIDSK